MADLTKDGGDVGLDDAVDDGLDPDDAGQQRCEVLAAICAVAAATVVLYGISQAIAISMGTAEGVSAWDLVFIAAGSSVLFPTATTGLAAHGLLLFAYLLVLVIGPGSWIGAIGTRVLQGIVTVGALLVVGGTVVIIRLVQEPNVLEEVRAPALDGSGGGTTDVGVAIVARGGSVLPVVAGIALAGYLTWLAARAYIDLPDVEPEDAEDAVSP